MSVLSLTLDDSDPSIVYTGDWIKGGDPDKETNGSTMAADGGSPNTFATVNFTGSRISVIGTIGKGDRLISSYTVDTLAGNKTTNFQPTFIAQSILYNFTFFQSDPLSPTSQHTLVISPIQGRLYIDSLLIIQDTLSSPPSSLSTRQSTPSSSSPPLSFTTQQPSLLFSLSSSPTPTGLSSVSPLISQFSLGATASASTSTQGKSEVPIGAIIGGVLGALTLICIFVLALLHLRRKKQEGHSDDNNGMVRPRSQSHLLATPYNISSASGIEYQRDHKGQPETSTTRVSNGLLQALHETQQVLTLTTVPPNMENSSNFLCPGALHNVPPSITNPCVPALDPPPEYQN